MIENKPLILIVDDILNNLQVIGNILIDRGYEISMAKNGSEALEMVGSVLPDLILLDIMMPDVNGFEVCEKLKENESTKDIPIIFLTAKSDISDIVKGFEVGGLDYILKPFNATELVVRVNNYLELSRSRKLLLQINMRLKNLISERNNCNSAILNSLDSVEKELEKNPNNLNENMIKTEIEQIKKEINSIS